MKSKTEIDYHSISTELINKNIGIGSHVLLMVTSSSMAPMLDVGDQITVQRFTAEKYQIGDIITTTQGSEAITHRIIARKDDQWITKGDRLSHFDPPLSDDQIVGKVIHIQHSDKLEDLNAKKWVRTNSLIGNMQKSCYHLSTSIPDRHILQRLCFRICKITFRLLIYITRIL